MAALSTNPKVLLTTTFRKSQNGYLDIFGEFVYGYPRMSMLRSTSPGLRFIKQNVPEVEILEYPLWEDFLEKLKEGWDVVGFSFYQSEIGEIKKMIEKAREAGVGEVWAGNFGALDYTIPSLVDKVVLGPGENAIASLFGYQISDDEIEHPVIMYHAKLLPGNIPIFTYGTLYTQSGCPFKCTFCQTPAFDKKTRSVNFRSIKRVLRYYKKIGVSDLFIIDESFGTNKANAERLSTLFGEMGFRWYAQTKASLVLRNLDDWYERGLRFPSIGVESMSPETLDAINKNHKVEQIIEYARKTGEKKDMFRVAYYMIGYENMGREQIIQDVKLLQKCNFDSYSTTLLTPYPQTPLWDDIKSKYGIFETDYRKFCSKHLVWNHPLFSPRELEELYREMTGYLNKPGKTYGKIVRALVTNSFNHKDVRSMYENTIRNPLTSMQIDNKKQIFFPRMRTAGNK